MAVDEAILQSIANTLADYRSGEIEPVDADEVGRWFAQFDEPLRGPMAGELDHVFKQTYIPKSTAQGFLSNLTRHDGLTKGNHLEFWRSSTLLDIQANGHSQREFLKLFDDILKRELGIQIPDCKGGGDFIYLDDVLFSGNRVKSDLTKWINTACPAKATVHVIVMGVHALGEWQTKRDLEGIAARLNKKVEVKIWRIVSLENRKFRRDTSDVLWPASLSAEAEAYSKAQRFPVELRAAEGKSDVFSGEEGRQALEAGFLQAGLQIRSFSKNPKDVLRPLGFGPFGVGFGSLVVTYRNCPNNAPLALWWGDPNMPKTHPFSKWRPLVPRKTYGGDDAF